MGTPFMDQVMVGLGSPLARQVKAPFSFGAKIRLRGELIQYGAAGDHNWKTNKNTESGLKKVSSHLLNKHKI